MEFTILLFIGFAIYVIYQLFTDKSFHKINQMQSQARVQQDRDRKFREDGHKRLQDEGYSFLDYDSFSDKAMELYKSVESDDPSLIERLDITPEEYPYKDKVPKEFVNKRFWESLKSVAFKLICCNEKFVESTEWTNDVFPNQRRDRDNFTWFCNVYKYAMMSNKDFEEVVGRKLTKEELTTGRPEIISGIVGKLYGNPMGRCGLDSFSPFFKDKVISCTISDYYPILIRRNNIDELYEWYGGDT